MACANQEARSHYLFFLKREFDLETDIKRKTEIANQITIHSHLFCLRCKLKKE